MAIFIPSEIWRTSLFNLFSRTVLPADSFYYKEVTPNGAKKRMPPIASKRLLFIPLCVVEYTDGLFFEFNFESNHWPFRQF
jgi:hypothetical protein